MPAQTPSTALSQRAREQRKLDDGNETAVAAVRINDVLSGRYRLEQKIGEGGMGTVYLAHDQELDRKVAVKLLAKNLVDDAEVVERFEREARLTARLDHPNIVPIYDVGRHQGRPFIVMKKLEGDTLAGVLRSKGGLSTVETLKLIRQLATGLDYIHGRGFIHRDVKAGNIFVGPEGHATILDFGILRSKSGTEAALTRTGVVMGTPHYMAPEQALGSKDVDHRVDLYALAVVLFECLSGTLPFEADSELRLIQMQAHSPPPDLLERAPWIPRPIAQVMQRALAKRADDRFSTGAALLSAVEAAFAQSPGAQATPAASEPSKVPAVTQLSARPSVLTPSPPLPAVGPPTSEYLLHARPARGPYFVLGAVVVGVIALAVVRPWEQQTIVAPIEARPDAGAIAQLEPDAGSAALDAGELAATIEDAGELLAIIPEPLDAGAEEVVDAGRKALGVRPPKKGRLNVITTHKGEPYWAQVLVDGVSKGRTPLLLELPSGRYQVRVERPGFKSQQREIRVASGKAAVVRIDLTQ